MMRSADGGRVNIRVNLTVLMTCVDVHDWFACCLHASKSYSAWRDQHCWL